MAKSIDLLLPIPDTAKNAGKSGIFLLPNMLSYGKIMFAGLFIE